MKIEEVQSTTKKQRVATHTHIKVRPLAPDLARDRSIGHPPITNAAFDFFFSRGKRTKIGNTNGH